MAKYYGLVSGLPVLTAEMAKPPYTAEEFYHELQPVLSTADRQLLEALRAERQHPQLIDWISTDALAPSPEGASEEPAAEDSAEHSASLTQLRALAQRASEGARLAAPKGIPSYQAHFVYELYYRPAADDWRADSTTPALIEELRHERIALEDRLSRYYYEWLGKSSSAFVRGWAELNKNLRNILALYTCRRLGWDPKDYIVGNGEVEELLRTSTSKDLGLGDQLSYLKDVLRIAEERDIARRERLIDLLKWQWMDEWTFVRVFDIDNVLCYYLRLEILSRWVQLDAEHGEATFRGIVHGLKGESARVLDDFRHSHR